MYSQYVKDIFMEVSNCVNLNKNQWPQYNFNVDSCIDKCIIITKRKLIIIYTNLVQVGNSFKTEKKIINYYLVEKFNVKNCIIAVSPKYINNNLYSYSHFGY